MRYGQARAYIQVVDQIRMAHRVGHDDMAERLALQLRRVLAWSAPTHHAGHTSAGNGPCTQ